LGLYTILWVGGVLAEAAVVTLAIRGRNFRQIPVFCSYIIWSLFVDILFYFFRQLYPDQERYFRAYLVEMIVDSLFQFAVLVELGWAVLRPIRASLPRQSIVILTLFTALAAALIWPIAGWTVPAYLVKTGRFYVHTQQTVAILRVVIFMALAGFSQMLSIGWRNRELQIATGLGFYSLCSLAVSVLHNHQAVGPQYAYLDELLATTYIGSMVYWLVSFSQKEAERQQFTPQMQNFLLAMAGAAHEGRLALKEGSPGKVKKPRP
jgi:hypothetical protein